jgi:sigma-B regulation protein RsbU (phosphoserine phosphatase)
MEDHPMATAAASRILVGAGTPNDADDVRRCLADAGHLLTWHPINGDLPEPNGTRLIIVENSHRPDEGWQFCRRLRAQLGEHYVPILVITSDSSPAARLNSLECGADNYLLRPFSNRELLTQVQSFLRLKDLYSRLNEKTAEVQLINRQLQQAHHQMDLELGWARRLRQSCRPPALTELPHVRFGVCHRPCGHVGGDFFDLFRLDERHVGFYLADAMSHGVPAGLLTAFLKQSMCFKEIVGTQYRLISPDEMLQRLNRDLVDQALAETPFITMVYAVLNFHDRSVAFARAGHPHPVYVPFDGPPHSWPSPGSLLGVFDTSFPIQRQKLRPGDKLLLFTDGLGLQEGSPDATPELLASVERHRTLPAQEFVDQLHTDLFATATHPDDFTLLAAELTA